MLFAEGEERLVGYNQEENWSDMKGLVHFEGCTFVVNCNKLFVVNVL